mgnify:CR=1 FL=1
MARRENIKPCKKQPVNCKKRCCSECCALRENENAMRNLFTSDLILNPET